ncbi:MAG: hypothetical protein ACKOLA_15330, partial [Spartobacteria bacterium]
SQPLIFTFRKALGFSVTPHFLVYIYRYEKLPPGIPGDLTRRLFQISEALSLEERNLRNNPSGLSRAADFIEEYFSRTGFGVSRQTF